MTDVTVRPLGVDDWETYRDVRLRALRESPEFFVNSADTEKEYGEDFWRARMERAARLVAEKDGGIIGVVCVGREDEAPELEEIEEGKIGELFGLWVQPDYRGKGVAWKLVDAGAKRAHANGWKHLLYWVATDNPRGVAFASSYGFRPTDLRRPMTLQHVDEDSEEVALVLPVAGDARRHISPADLD